MKAVIQRVSQASVCVNGEMVGSCGKGLLVLLGVADGDTEEMAELLCRKIAALRIFPDEAGKMNRSVRDIDGEILVVSQFTLLANCRHGNRPDFFAAAKPELAKQLYGFVLERLKGEVRRVECGVFGAHMEVSLWNDGPVTILLDTNDLR